MAALELNNPTLFNAALNGATMGQLAGTQQQDNTTADYADVTAVAIAFATAVDAAINIDTTISVGSNPPGATTQPPTSAAQASNSFAKSACMFGICFGYMFERRTNSNTGGGVSSGFDDGIQGTTPVFNPDSPAAWADAAVTISKVYAAQLAAFAVAGSIV